MKQKNDETIMPSGMTLPGLNAGAVGDGTALALLNDPNAEAEIGVIRQNAWQIVGEKVTAEIVGAIGGLRTDELIYNYPKRTSGNQGRKHWRACEVMDGGCPFEGQPHVHVVDVGVKGAMAAMAAYGSISITMPDPPELIEVGSEATWRVKVIGVDKRQGNELEHYQYTPALKKYGNTVVMDEYGAAICQSKGRRNMALMLLPGHLRTMWVQDYLNGKEPFDPQRVLDMPPPASQLPEHKEKAKPPRQAASGDGQQKKKKKQKKQPPARSSKPTSGTGFDDMVAKIADTLGLEIDQVKKYSETVGTAAKATVLFAQALNEEEKLEDLNEKISIWLEQVESEKEKAEPDSEDGGDGEAKEGEEEIPMDPKDDVEKAQTDAQPMEGEQEAKNDLGF